MSRKKNPLNKLIRHHEKSVKYWEEEIADAVHYLHSSNCPKEHKRNIKERLPKWYDKLLTAKLTVLYLKKARNK